MTLHFWRLQPPEKIQIDKLALNFEMCATPNHGVSSIGATVARRYLMLRAYTAATSRSAMSCNAVLRWQPKADIRFCRDYLSIKNVCTCIFYPYVYEHSKHFEMLRFFMNTFGGLPCLSLSGKMYRNKWSSIFNGKT